jgi:hypothetical protein
MKDLDILDNLKLEHHKTISVLILLRRFGFDRNMLEDARNIMNKRYTSSMVNSLLTNHNIPRYPVAPASNTWTDKLLASLGIIITVAMIGLMCGGIWKCLLLLCAC